MADSPRDHVRAGRAAARWGRVGAFAAAVMVVALALGIAAFAAGRPVLGVVGVVIAVVLAVFAGVGVRAGSRARRDPLVRARGARLARARYRDAYPPSAAHEGSDHSDD